MKRGQHTEPKICSIRLVIDTLSPSTDRQEKDDPPKQAQVANRPPLDRFRH